MCNMIHNYFSENYQQYLSDMIPGCLSAKELSFFSSRCTIYSSYCSL